MKKIIIAALVLVSLSFASCTSMGGYTSRTYGNTFHSVDAFGHVTVVKTVADSNGMPKTVTFDGGYLK